LEAFDFLNKTGAKVRRAQGQSTNRPFICEFLFWEAYGSSQRRDQRKTLGLHSVLCQLWASAPNGKECHSLTA
jgi:hypothetical protein